MSNRVTESDLNDLANMLNEVFNKPARHYHIEYACGAVSLVQMVNERGGIKTVLGPCTKRELYRGMQTLLIGAAMARGLR